MTFGHFNWQVRGKTYRFEWMIFLPYYKFGRKIINVKQGDRRSQIVLMCRLYTRTGLTAEYKHGTE